MKGMEQERVMFSATITDPVKPAELPDPDPPPTHEPEPVPMLTPMPTRPVPPPLTRSPTLPCFDPTEPALPPCCTKKLPPILEHPHERFERHSELVDALPSIFIAFGVAYALGVLTGGMIFSPPSMIDAL